MILTRRQFLKNSAAVLAIPAIVKAENIMKVVVPGQRVKFRVPDLRGHYATRPQPLNMGAEREMSAVEEWAQQNEIRDDWADRYQTSIRAQYADQAGAAINRKIDEGVLARIQGHDITGVWLDESVRMEHLIDQKTGEIHIATGPALGCIPCDGRELSAIEFPHLYKVLGNKYG
jgi:hypothetical protein